MQGKYRVSNDDTQDNYRTETEIRYTFFTCSVLIHSPDNFRIKTDIYSEEVTDKYRTIPDRTD